MVSTSSLFKLTVCPVVHRFLSVLFLVFISSVLCLSHSIWEGVKLGVGFHRPGTGPLRGNFEFERHSEVRGRLGLSARQRPLRLNGYFFSWMWRFSSRSPKFYLKRWKKKPSLIEFHWAVASFFFIQTEAYPVLPNFFSVTGKKTHRKTRNNPSTLALLNESRTRKRIPVTVLHSVGAQFT